MKQILLTLRIIFIITFLPMASIICQTNLWQRSNFPSYYSSYIQYISAKDSLIYVGDYNGLARSTNSGLSWESINFFNNPYPQPLTITNSGFVFVVNNSGYLYRSTDNGNTWVKCTNVLFYSPTMICDSNGYIYIASTSGIYRSIDSGITWTLQNNGLILGSYPRTLLVNNSKGNLIVDTPAGIFQSTDNADSWIRLSLNPSFAPSEMALNSRDYIFLLGHPVSGSGSLIYRSTDNGISWQIVKNSYFNLLG